MGQKRIREIVEDSRDVLGIDIKLDDGDFHVYNEYVGGGYGFMSKEKLEAVRLLADTEGLFIDPVYTATAMACLIDLCREGTFKEGKNVVFLHTGGVVALFPYKEPIRAYTNGKEVPWTISEWSASHE